MLGNLLTTTDFSLALSPGFFRFYALTGFVHALEENHCLDRIRYVSGSSAGALVGGFIASGVKPSKLIDTLLALKREDFWDLEFSFGGLLKGQKFHQILCDNLEVTTIEECKIPFGATVYELFQCKTKLIQEGCLPTAIRTSCTFPGLFHPVVIDGSTCIDGGVFDRSGMMALPGIPESELVVNVVFGKSNQYINASRLPEKFSHAKLLTIIFDNIPHVHPFNMDSMGKVAYELTRAATFKALDSAHMQQLSERHWCCLIDGNNVDQSIPLGVISTQENDFLIHDCPSFSFFTNVDDNQYSENAGSKKRSIQSVEKVTSTKSSNRKKLKIPGFIGNNNEFQKFCSRLSVSPIDYQQYEDTLRFNSIDELTTSKEIEIRNNILKDTLSIGLLLEVPETNESRSSRRKSVTPSTKVLDKKWIYGIILRDANSKEKQLGFTHLVRVKWDASEEDRLVILSILGYYDKTTNRPLKENKTALPIETWIALRDFK